MRKSEINVESYDRNITKLFTNGMQVDVFFFGQCAEKRSSSDSDKNISRDRTISETCSRSATNSACANLPRKRHSFHSQSHMHIFHFVVHFFSRDPHPGGSFFFSFRRRVSADNFFLNWRFLREITFNRVR